jgi:hypothetical protein
MNTQIRKVFILILFAVLLAQSLTTEAGGSLPAAMAQPLTSSNQPPPFSARDAGQFTAEVPVAWFELAYDLVRDEALSPPLAARLFGYLGVALYEALAPGMPGYQSLAGQLNGLSALPQPADHAYHWPTVANRTLAVTLQTLLSPASSASQASIRALERRFVERFRPELPPGVNQRSVERGLLVSQAIQAWAAGDGAASYSACAFTLPTGAGLWSPTPPGYRPPLLPCWGQLRPFVLADGGQCSPAPPPPYSEHPGSAFYQEAWEVYTSVNRLTGEQMAITRFWADDPGRTGTPPGHSISILSQILVQQASSLETAAEAYARTGIALADSFIACWWTKYQHNLLRPITYIHSVVGDTAWSTPVNTPPFPEYTSGHSVQSAAAAQVLAGLFGEVAFTDHTHDRLGYAPRSFPNFFAFAEEAAISRLYGGIHYRSAIERGVEQGRCVGRLVSELRFRTD